MGPGSWRDVDTVEAARLVAEGSVHVVDVRTPEEYRDLGHIPGAILLPVDLVVAGAATLPRDGRPLLVHCEHGIRSVHACDVLAHAGLEGLLNLRGGLSVWTGPREFGPDAPAVSGPSSWLLQCADLLPPRRGRALDVASGRGRHALLLAAAGFEVRAVDRDDAALAALDAIARRLGLPVTVERLDLETGEVDLGTATFSLVAVFHYLHRPLFPAIVDAMARARSCSTRRSRWTRRRRAIRGTRPSCSSTASCRGSSTRSRSCASATGSTKAGTSPVWRR